MKRVFDWSASGPEATRRLLYIRQGARSVSDYGIEFRTMAATADWTQAVFFGAFQKGLDDRIADRPVTCETPTSLEVLIDLTIHEDSRITERRELQSSTHQTAACYQEPRRRQPILQPYSPSLPAPQTLEAVVALQHAPEPMQIGRAHLTPQECTRRFRE